MTVRMTTGASKPSRTHTMTETSLCPASGRPLPPPGGRVTTPRAAWWPEPDRDADDAVERGRNRAEHGHAAATIFPRLAGTARMISVTQPVAGCDRSCIVDRANWAVSARWHPRPDCGADKLVVKVDSFDADGISSVDVSIWAGPVRSGGEAGRARHQREDTMTHYLLSVHSVEGEVR